MFMLKNGRLRFCVQKRSRRLRRLVAPGQESKYYTLSEKRRNFAAGTPPSLARFWFIADLVTINLIRFVVYDSFIDNIGRI